MNNFYEMRSSVEPLIDLIPREKKEKIDESLTEINTRGKKLDKSRKSVDIFIINYILYTISLTSLDYVIFRVC